MDSTVGLQLPSFFNLPPLFIHPTVGLPSTTQWLPSERDDHRKRWADLNDSSLIGFRISANRSNENLWFWKINIWASDLKTTSYRLCPMTFESLTTQSQTGSIFSGVGSVLNQNFRCRRIGMVVWIRLFAWRASKRTPVHPGFFWILWTWKVGIATFDQSFWNR